MGIYCCYFLAEVLRPFLVVWGHLRVEFGSFTVTVLGALFEGVGGAFLVVVW